MSAENPLGSQLQVGWQGKAESKFKTKAEVTQEKVSVLAAELQGKYFSTNQESTRRIVAEMKAILASVEASCKAHENEEVCVQKKSSFVFCNNNKMYSLSNLKFFSLCLIVKSIIPK